MKCDRCNGSGYLTFPHISKKDINTKNEYDILNEAMNENYNIMNCGSIELKDGKERLYQECNICKGKKDIDWIENIFGVKHPVIEKMEKHSWWL
jgi:hypothetical protein